MDINWDEIREQIKEADDDLDKEIRDYGYIKRISAYMNGLSNIGVLSTEYRNLIDMLKITAVKYNEQLTKLLAGDMKELRACLDAGAYKATLILAGSVLEAFLLDWLSEKDGVNYFEVPYTITKNNNTFKARGLADYIDAINEIEKPYWLESSEKAHFIREKRNLVHASLYLKEGQRIDKAMCETVIAYLEEIIDTRFDDKVKSERVNKVDYIVTEGENTICLE